MYFGARAHSLTEIRFLGEADFEFAAILRKLRAAGYDGGFCFAIGLESVEQSRDAIHEMWHRPALRRSGI